MQNYVTATVMAHRTATRVHYKYSKRDCKISGDAQMHHVSRVVIAIIAIIVTAATTTTPGHWYRQR